jgi:hypothetical protein
MGGGGDFPSEEATTSRRAACAMRGAVPRMERAGHVHHHPAAGERGEEIAEELHGEEEHAALLVRRVGEHPPGAVHRDVRAPGGDAHLALAHLHHDAAAPVRDLRAIPARTEAGSAAYPRAVDSFTTEV